MLHRPGAVAITYDG